ncbi:MFS transporter [Candidatus Kapabacteria bacterium]|nr:MFS transporter [Candidatus Kapabacteria bacterium]
MNISTKKERFGWYFYDFAASAFSTTVVTVFLEPFLTSIATNASVGGVISPFGIDMNPGSFFFYCTSISVILQVFIMPLVGAITDYTGRKKQLLGLFAYIGAFSTIGLYFLDGENYLFGGGLFILANLCYGVAIVALDSILNDISTKEERDKVSSSGFAFGYVGGGILLLINLLMFNMADDNSKGEVVRISLASAGVWWAIFTIFPMIWIRKYKIINVAPKKTNLVKVGFHQLFNTIKDIKNYPMTLTFLIAFLIYNDGVQTVLIAATPYGTKELGLSTATMTKVILLVQFVAFFGAFFFSWLSGKIGSKNTILTTLVIWSMGLIYAYSFLDGENGFYALGILIGFVMPGTQAISRSLYSKLIPKGKEAEYFSLYEVAERGTSAIGPLVFGLSFDLTNSYRAAVLSLIIFLVVGGVILMFFNLKKAELEVSKYS